MSAISQRETIPAVVAGLDQWLDAMRGPMGYGGPVVHWWRDCLLFCGTGLDWRYEGIIVGYLLLFERTDDTRWLTKARRAGDDLRRGQLPNGQFRHSRFELNPGTGGTPHEAAADIGLLWLARTLRAQGDPAWQGYLDTAAFNLQATYLHRLWNPADQRFEDHPCRSSFVPNKAATLVEALSLWADLTGQDEPLERYVRPTVAAILAHQVQRPGHPLHGAIAQNTLDGHLVEKYFPYYNARCVPGLLSAYQRLGDPRYLDAACDALGFVWRSRTPEGYFPQVIYPNGRVVQHPSWVAGLGDILRAADLLRAYGASFPIDATLERLLEGRLASGGIASATGFAALVPNSQAPEVPEFRDLLPVCGWADKAFRYLAGRVSEMPEALVEPVSRECTFRGRLVELREDERTLGVYAHGESVYQWRKGDTWARIIRPWAVTA